MDLVFREMHLVVIPCDCQHTNKDIRDALILILLKLGDGGMNARGVGIGCLIPPTHFSGKKQYLLSLIYKFLTVC